MKNEKEKTLNNEIDIIILNSLYLTEFFMLDILSYIIKKLYKKDFYTSDFDEIKQSFYQNKNQLWLKYIKLILGNIKYEFKNMFKNEDYRKIIKNKELNEELKNHIFQYFKKDITIGNVERLL